jgi:hypothetical protein
VSGARLNDKLETIMKTIWMVTATSVLLSSAAMAQTAVTTPAPAEAAQAQPTASTAATPNANMRQQIRANLQQAGFTDVTMTPESFLVQAKDKSGNPVIMMIKPSSITGVVDLGAAASSQAATSANQDTTPASQAVATVSTFMAVPTGESMSSKTVGLDVYNNTNQDIGTIKDVAYDGSTIKAYIVGVGGFLGIGDHYVAVNPASIHITYDANAKTWHATMNTTADELKAAPEFKYPGQA